MCEFYKKGQNVHMEFSIIGSGSNQGKGLSMIHEKDKHMRKIYNIYINKLTNLDI